MNTMDKKFIAVLVIIIAAFGGFLAFGNKSSAPGTSGSSSQVSNHVEGSKDLSVEVIEYGDFQCPSCGQFFPIVSAIKAKYKDRVRFVFKNFPLDTIHPNARAAHRAAEAAGKQGKFFEMHDLLYQNQNDWSRSSAAKTIFEGYAKSLNLDLSAFATDYSSEEVNATINADVAEGQGKKVNGTPTFFFNGKQMQNGDISSVDLFSAKLDDLLPKVETPAPATTSTTEAVTPTPSPETTN